MSAPDVLIIGSGYGGMLAAYKLTRAGARVLLLERGRRWGHREFQRTWHPAYLAELYDFGMSDSFREVYRGSRVLGGGSVLNDMMSQRTPRQAFDWWDEDTGRRAWPVGLDRQALDPYYDEAESLLGVRQLEWGDIPRIGANFGRMFKEAGLSCDRGSFNFGSCGRCGYCEAGCDMMGAKLTLVDRVLPLIEKTGDLTIREQTTAVRLSRGPRGYKVHVGQTEQIGDGPMRASEIIEAPRVVLAAGPLGTVPLLQRSAVPGLPALGRWASNNGDVNFVFQTPAHFEPNVGYKSTTNAGMISYAFWESHRATLHPGMFPLPVFAALDVRKVGGLAWGLDHKRFVRDHVLHRLIPVNAMAQLPSELRYALDKKGRARLINPRTPALLAHVDALLGLARRVAEGSGGDVLLTGSGDEPLDQGGNHLLGGARMSDDRRFGVCNPDGQVWGHPGLWVSDCAAIPASLGINPSLTIAANALRIGEAIARDTVGGAA